MEEAKPVTVVVIGPTQNGKSTFINMARSLSKQSSDAVKIGNGSESCTVDCEAKDLLIPLTSYKLVDPSTGRDIPIPDDEEELFDSLWGKKRYQVVPVGPERPPIRLRIIDTPGLDDSKGRDAEHIQKVLQAVVKEPFITAIAFICSVGNAFSAGFQDVYEYYSHCMPNLMAPGALAVINTNFSVTTWQQMHERIVEESGMTTFPKESKTSRLVGALTAHAPTMPSLSRPKSTKEIVMAGRRKAFNKIFGKDPVHFFIDSKPDRRSPFEQMVSRNNFVDILNFLSDKGNMPTGQMNLNKSPAMSRVDNVLATLLFSAKTNWQMDQTSLQQLAQNNGDKMVKARSNIQRRIGQSKNDIETWEKELARLDNDTEYALTPNITIHEDMSTANRVWMGITARRFKGTKVITEHTIPKFFVEAKSNNPKLSRWTNTSGSEAVTKSWRGEYEANWAEVPDLTARTYTWNKFWYHERIEDLEERLANKRVDLKVDEKDLADIQKIDSNSETVESKRIRVLNDLIAKADALIRELQTESVPLDTGFNDTAQRRYRKLPSAINDKDLLDLIEESSPKLAAEWMGLGTARS